MQGAAVKRDVLLIADLDLALGVRQGTVLSHIKALSALSEHNVVVVDFRIFNSSKLCPLERFDVVVLHYSLIFWKDYYISPFARERIRKFKGLKIAFVQDEYRWVDRTVASLSYLGIDVLFSVVNKEILNKVYHHPELRSVEKYSVLTGYVDEDLLHWEVPPYFSRPIDVGYRGRKLPPWLGEFAQQKWLIGYRFLKDAQRYDLKCDISWEEKDRIYGKKWYKFLSSCKAVLGTESGASVCDFKDEIRPKVEAHLKRAPDTPFEVLRELYFPNIDGKLLIHVISPRHFEAAALRTLMILYPGDYSGILKPWRHYVPLYPDHSNIEDVIEVLQHHGKATQIIKNAYSEIACNPKFSYRALTKLFDEVISSKPPLSPSAKLEVPSISRLNEVCYNKWHYDYLLKRFFLRPLKMFLIKSYNCLSRPTREKVKAKISDYSGRWPLLRRVLMRLGLVT